MKKALICDGARLAHPPHPPPCHCCIPPPKRRYHRHPLRSPRVVGAPPLRPPPLLCVDCARGRPYRRQHLSSHSRRSLSPDLGPTVSDPSRQPLLDVGSHPQRHHEGEVVHAVGWAVPRPPSGPLLLSLPVVIARSRPYGVGSITPTSAHCGVPLRRRCNRVGGTPSGCCPGLPQWPALAWWPPNLGPASSSSSVASSSPPL
jgi:hypothetical protein